MENLTLIQVQRRSPEDKSHVLREAAARSWFFWQHSNRVSFSGRHVISCFEMNEMLAHEL